MLFIKRLLNNISPRQIDKLLKDSGTDREGCERHYKIEQGSHW